MKKILVFALFLLAAFSLAACQSGEGDPETLVVQFVPSTTVDSELLTKVGTLGDLLEGELADAGYDINVVVSIGTSYAAVVQAMVSNQVHVGFLTAQQYAQTTLQYPDKVNVLLTSVRNAYNAQIANGEEIDDLETVIDNINAAGYDGSYNTEVKVSSYHSMLLVNASDVAAARSEGISWLEGKTVATQHSGSGSGYVYPSFLLYENGLEFTTETPGAGQVQNVVYQGHQNAVLALLNGEVDAAFAYWDARISSAFDDWKAANPGENLFEVTQVAALSTGIYNDTISTTTSLSDGLREALAQAFIDLIATTEGAEIFEIYDHTGYLRAMDEDYDGERGMYQFLHSEE